jgi:hypothetical protein
MSMMSRMGAATLSATLAVAGYGVAAAQPGSADLLGGRGAPQIDVEHAAVRLVVIPELRHDVSVDVQHGPSHLPPLVVRREGSRIVVDGGLEGGSHSLRCVGDRTATHALTIFGHTVTRLRDDRAVRVQGVGQVDLGELPVVTAHVPQDAAVAVEGAVYSEVGATRSLALVGAGCGDWTVGPVSGRMTAKLSGSGDLHGMDVGSLGLDLSGSGGVDLRHVRGGDSRVVIAGSGDLRVVSLVGPLRAQIAGSGDLTAERQDGPIHATIAGSGGVRLKGGHASDVQVEVSGSGSFDLGGDAGRVAAAASGSGDIRIAHASGPISRTSTGSAQIEIGR